MSCILKTCISWTRLKLKNFFSFMVLWQVKTQSPCHLSGEPPDNRLVFSQSSLRGTLPNTSFNPSPTGCVASLAAAAASPLSTDSRLVPSRCGLSGLGVLGSSLAREKKRNQIFVSDSGSYKSLLIHFIGRTIITL